ncbi:MAG: HAD family hydrolase, partial [Jaaginema sp. PMC 1079.18]|nr:HAD family hydrolase [Jaaginema sp. PMC 1079.18]
DFDGPIMDVSERYYRVYQWCLKQCRQPQQPTRLLSKSEFWRLKRSRVRESCIGQLSGLNEAQARQFAQLRRENVHSLPYLVYDRPISSAIATLEYLHQAENVELGIMTMRRWRELRIPLEDNNLQVFFRRDRCYCLHNDYLKTTDTEDKTRLMQQALKELPPVAQTWMIGDTEADIIAAQTHNVKVIGVLSGIRDREQLQQYQPDYIARDLAAAVNLIAQRTSIYPSATST